MAWCTSALQRTMITTMTTEPPPFITYKRSLLIVTVILRQSYWIGRTMVVSFLSSGGLVNGRPAVHPISRRVRVLASSQTLADASPKTSDKAEDSRKSKIYVGKGRFVEDDPSKYPEKTSLTGGFAGGEVRAVSQRPFFKGFFL